MTETAARDMLRKMAQAFYDGNREGFTDSWVATMEDLADMAFAMLGEKPRPEMGDHWNKRIREDLADPMTISPAEALEAEHHAAVLATVAPLPLESVIRAQAYDIDHDAAGSGQEYVTAWLTLRSAEAEYMRRRGEPVGELWRIVDNPGPSRPPHFYHVETPAAPLPTSPRQLPYLHLMDR